MASQQQQSTPGRAWAAFDGVVNSITIDIGRFLGASAIFYFHLGLFIHLAFSGLGEKAVEYFVIVAGISYVAFSKSKPAGPSEYLRYAKARLASQFPVFFLVNLTLYAASFVVPSALGRPFYFSEFLASVTGISQYLNWEYISKVMWFMPFIMQVYLLLPLLDGVARRLNAAILMVCATAVSFLLAEIVSHTVNSNFQAMLICKNWSPLFRLPEVCLGVILGRMALTRSGMGPGLLAVALYGIFSMLTPALLPRLDSAGHFYMPWEGFVTPAILFAASALIFLLCRGANWKWLRTLSPAPFAFYLIQGAPLGYIHRRFGANPAVWLAYFVACWVAAVALGLFPTWVSRRMKGKSA